ncbi:hypothetical protein STEG23_017227 [Scotinomys teguina]
MHGRSRGARSSLKAWRDNGFRGAKEVAASEEKPVNPENRAIKARNWGKASPEKPDCPECGRKTEGGRVKGEEEVEAVSSAEKEEKGKEQQ